MEWAANKVGRDLVSPHHATRSVEDKVEASAEERTLIGVDIG